MSISITKQLFFLFLSCSLTLSNIKGAQTPGEGDIRPHFHDNKRPERNIVGRIKEIEKELDSLLNISKEEEEEIKTNLEKERKECLKKKNIIHTIQDYLPILINNWKEKVKKERNPMDKHHSLHGTLYEKGEKIAELFKEVEGIYKASAEIKESEGFKEESIKGSDTRIEKIAERILAFEDFFKQLGINEKTEDIEATLHLHTVLEREAPGLIKLVQRHESVKEDIHKKNRNICDLNNQLKKVKVEIGELKGQLGKKEQTIGDMNAHMDNLKSQLEKVKVEIGELKGQLDKKEQTIGEVNAHMDNLKSQLEKAKVEIQKLENSEQYLLELRGKVESLENKKGEDARTITNFHRALEERNDVLSRKNNKLVSIRSDNNNLLSQLRQAKVEIGELKGQLDKKEQHTHNMSVHIDDQKNQLERAGGEIRELQDQLGKKEQTIADMNAHTNDQKSSELRNYKILSFLFGLTSCGLLALRRSPSQQGSSPIIKGYQEGESMDKGAGPTHEKKIATSDLKTREQKSSRVGLGGGGGGGGEVALLICPF